MSSELEQFLYALATDADARASFQADPDTVLATARLGREETEAVRSGDSDRIRTFLSTEFAAPVAVVVAATS